MDRESQIALAYANKQRNNVKSLLGIVRKESGEVEMKRLVDKLKIGHKYVPGPPVDRSKGMTDEQAFEKDWTRGCEVCGQKPVVRATGLCGPCTWGESETAGGNW